MSRVTLSHAVTLYQPWLFCEMRVVHTHTHAHFGADRCLSKCILNRGPLSHSTAVNTFFTWTRARFTAPCPLCGQVYSEQCPVRKQPQSHKHINLWATPNWNQVRNMVGVFWVEDPKHLHTVRTSLLDFIFWLQRWCHSIKSKRQKWWWKQLAGNFPVF